MKKFILIILVFVIVGCGATSGKSVQVKQSGFNNSKVVFIEPHGGKCSMTQCLGLGAQWNSENPERVFIIVNSFLEYVAITGAKLSVDGEIVTLQQSQYTTTLTYELGLRNSAKAFSADFDIIPKMLKAENIWLRMYTPNGYKEELIKSGTETTKAYHALERFAQNINRS
ncbi:hypothetical protein [Glaciecola sp. 1036]|uniref:hypothetical protein n=1 Tax=Alteromonadaceae TaxID=72275 RepID=UPI003D037B14